MDRRCFVVGCFVVGCLGNLGDAFINSSTLGARVAYILLEIQVQR